MLQKIITKCQGWTTLLIVCVTQMIVMYLKLILGGLRKLLNLGGRSHEFLMIHGSLR